MINGAAVVEDLAFTDNSKSMRNGMFRLGARVVGRLPEGVVIKEAVSKAFKVKERRVKFYRRHKTLSLKDGSESLLHIGKTLAQKLAAENIHMVQDFLQLYHTDKQALESILRLPDNKWSELVKNAKSCPLSQEVYEYSDSASGVRLALDCVFNIKAVVLNGTIFKLYSALDDYEKDKANKIRRRAYEKRKELQESHTLTLTQKQCEFGSTSSILHSSAHLDAVETGMEKVPVARLANPVINKEGQGQDICGFAPNQTHQEFYENQYKLQESHTPITSTTIREELGSPSRILHPTIAQHPDATALDTEKFPTTSFTDPTTTMEKSRDEGICTTSPDQTCQGTEWLLHPNSVGHCAEVGHKTANSNRVHQTLAASSEPQLPMDQPQDLSFQYQSFPAPPTADFFGGLDLWFDMLNRTTGMSSSQDHLQSANANAQDMSLQSILEELEFNIEGSNLPFDSSIQCNFLKRPRYN